MLVMKVSAPQATRPYRLQRRAAEAEGRAERVLDAAIGLWLERWYDEITLEDIARRSGVSLSTIMRRFGSKEGIVSAVVQSDRIGIFARRDAVAAGDVDGAIREVVEGYERVGDAVVRNLALETRIPAIGQAVEMGRNVHRDFIARVFSDWLVVKGRNYDRRLAQFIVASDVYTWKLFRRDHGLSKTETIRAMRELVEHLMDGN
jgi:AcrR family transcriptional regulator